MKPIPEGLYDGDELVEVAPAADKWFVETAIARLNLPPEGFRLSCGEFLHEIHVAYETYGKLDAEGSNAILICSPLTTDAHAAGWHESASKPGWWNEMIGPGKAIDTRHKFVIAQNMLGGCKGTTGPGSLNPATGKPYGAAFPEITIEDIVRVQQLLVASLGVETLEAVIGGSMGGMQALQWSISFPTRVRKCISIASAASLSAQALGFEIIGRKAILSDANYHGGDYYSAQVLPEAGLKFARMIGHLTYLSALSMHEKFGRHTRPDHIAGKFETGFEVESYLTYQGDRFAERFDANSYLHITYAMDRFDLVNSYGSLERAFGETQAEFLLVALSSDWLFPPAQIRELSRVLLGLNKVVSEVELDSPYGHDAFLLEVDHLGQVIHAFLEGRDSRSRPPAVLTRRLDDGEVEEESASCFTSAQDYRNLRQLIRPGSHIVDIGCGDGSLIDELYREHRVTGIGIDINLENVVECLKKNVPVFHNNVDEGLSSVGDALFDYAVLNRTLQVVHKPALVLREMLRVARKGIVSFPNFAYLQNRYALVSKGIMPVSKALPYSWHNTPNIHLFSYADFHELCRHEGILIEKVLPFSQSPLGKLLIKLGKINLGAEHVLALISRAKEPYKEI